MRTALLISTAQQPDEAQQAAEARRPQPDYLALAEALPARVIDRRAAREAFVGATAAVLRRAGPDAAQALLAVRRRAEFDHFVCDSERIALPLAALLRAVGAAQPVSFIAHRMTVSWKRTLWRVAALNRRAGAVFCYADRQAAALRRLGLPKQALVRMPFQVDHRFFVPDPDANPGRRIVSVGQERRDYPTLVNAARTLDCEVSILARSPWSRSRSRQPETAVPDNVRFLSNLSYLELRGLYAAAALVAVPVQAVDFQAGITSLLEAMAMARPVVATANPGLRELFEDGEAGLWVPPGDSEALARALAHLLDHPAQAAAMGRRGREIVARGLTLEHWVARIARGVRGN